MADKISDKKEQEIERLIRQLDHKEHELEEKYCDVGKSIMDKLEKENQEIGHMVDEVIQLKRKLIKRKDRSVALPVINIMRRTVFTAADVEKN